MVHAIQMDHHYLEMNITVMVSSMGAAIGYLPVWKKNTVIISKMDLLPILPLSLVRIQRQRTPNCLLRRYASANQGFNHAKR